MFVVVHLARSHESRHGIAGTTLWVVPQDVMMSICTLLCTNSSLSAIEWYGVCEPLPEVIDNPPEINIYVRTEDGKFLVLPLFDYYVTYTDPEFGLLLLPLFQAGPESLMIFGDGAFVNEWIVSFDGVCIQSLCARTRLYLIA